MHLRVEAQSRDMPAIACLTKEWKFKERIIVKSSHCGRAPVYGLPDPIEEAAEASKCLADVDMNVLALSGSVSPNRRSRNGFGGKPYTCRRCKPDPAGNDGILAIESELPTAVRG